MTAAVHHVDLGGPHPFRPSRVLTAWTAARAAERKTASAHADMARLQAEVAAFRRVGGADGRPRRQAQQSAAAGLSVPAFAQVGGQRAFVAGQTDRLTSTWLSVNSGINADLQAALDTLRARSRDWCVNTDAGARYLELVADNIVGSNAPMLQVRGKLANGQPDDAANTAIEEAWRAWCMRCDVSSEQDFTAMCRNVVQGAAREGEFLARRVRDRSLFGGLGLQLLDVDRIDSAMNVSPTVPGAAAIRMGVEVNSLGRKQAIWLHAHHPGDYAAGPGARGASGRVAADMLLHGFVRYRPEQVRGYPWTSPVLRRANMLAQYEEFAMVAAKVGAAKMGFYVADKDVLDRGMSLDELKDATGQLMQDVEAGMMEALPPGVSVESFNPDYPHQNYAAFVTQGKRDLAAGLSVAHHNLSGDMTGVNYSSARIAELSERRHWRTLQRWLIGAFVRPVFEDWLQLALLRQDIRLPSGAPLPADRFDKFASAAAFQPPGWAWVDPEADIKAAALAATYDIRSLRAITDEQGVDLDETLADKRRLIDRYTALGLPMPPWLSGGAAMSAGGGVAQPAAAPQPEPAA